MGIFSKAKEIMTGSISLPKKTKKGRGLGLAGLLADERRRSLEAERKYSAFYLATITDMRIYRDNISSLQEAFDDAMKEISSLQTRNNRLIIKLAQAKKVKKVGKVKA